MQCGPWGMIGESDLLFHNRGDGTFEEVSKKAGVDDPNRYYGLGVIWGDYDNDGWPDLYVANDAGPNYLYHNKHDGTFEEVGMLSGRRAQRRWPGAGLDGRGLGRLSARRPAVDVRDQLPRAARHSVSQSGERWIFRRELAGKAGAAHLPQGGLGHRLSSIWTTTAGWIFSSPTATCIRRWIRFPAACITANPC